MNAKLSEVKAGDTLEAVGFDCLGDGQVTVAQDEHGLFFPCRAGKHYLDGQLDDDGSLVGLFRVTKT